VTDTIQAFTTTDLHSLTTTQSNAFSNDIPSMTDAQVNALVTATPIVLDLTGAGIHTTSASTAGVDFDITGTGKTDTVGWTTGGEGFLAMDLNHDGRINSGTELFGSGTVLANGQRAANGYQAMAQYDSNGDGLLDARDTHFKDLQVWVDANHDGKTEGGELKSLGDLGIVSLDLHGLVSHTADNGNTIGLTSSYTTASGATHEMADVWLTKDTPDTTTAHASAPALGDLLAAPATDLLPGHVEHAALVSHTDASHASGLVDQKLLEEEERNRHNNPLI
jgi:hypothetical protein